VPEAILRKPGPLEGDEVRKMQAHPIIGETIVSPLRSASNLLPIIRNHHERFDGHGYPDSLEGARIPLLARIISVCDAFDALINDRPYRTGIPVADAIGILREGAGTQWDPEVVETFVNEIPAIRRLDVA
jgi:HD-GYP domain-containing protein (c-di-GMP phosphodiesterase class II)